MDNITFANDPDTGLYPFTGTREDWERSRAHWLREYGHCQVHLEPFAKDRDKIECMTYAELCSYYGVAK